AAIGLALERGAGDGLCGWDWSSLPAQTPDYHEKYKIILQTGIEPNPELTKIGVPTVQNYVSGGDDRQVLDLFLAQQIFGRPYVAPPGIAEEHLAILRRAFDLTMSDAQFIVRSR
ncbi:MAG: hypothetical protein IT537_10635, partial [Hyphomicrobiales bacterium]|nr:hypothetical protein [Hyphomicrobiales bacterium]